MHVCEALSSFFVLFPSLSLDFMLSVSCYAFPEIRRPDLRLHYYLLSTERRWSLGDMPACRKSNVQNLGEFFCRLVPMPAPFPSSHPSSLPLFPISVILPPPFPLPSRSSFPFLPNSSSFPRHPSPPLALVITNVVVELRGNVHAVGAFSGSLWKVKSLTRLPSEAPSLLPPAPIPRVEREGENKTHFDRRIVLPWTKFTIYVGKTVFDLNFLFPTGEKCNVSPKLSP